MDNADQDFCEMFLARLKACADDAARVELIRMKLNQEFTQGYESGYHQSNKRRVMPPLVSVHGSKADE